MLVQMSRYISQTEQRNWMDPVHMMIMGLLCTSGHVILKVPRLV